MGRYALSLPGVNPLTTLCRPEHYRAAHPLHLALYRVVQRVADDDARVHFEPSMFERRNVRPKSRCWYRGRPNWQLSTRRSGLVTRIWSPASRPPRDAEAVERPRAPPPGHIGRWRRGPICPIASGTGPPYTRRGGSLTRRRRQVHRVGGRGAVQRTSSGQPISSVHRRRSVLLMAALTVMTSLVGCSKSGTPQGLEHRWA